MDGGAGELIGPEFASAGKGEWIHFKRMMTPGAVALGGYSALSSHQ
jgi:hypothetical protein